MSDDYKILPGQVTQLTTAPAVHGTGTWALPAETITVYHPTLSGPCARCGTRPATQEVMLTNTVPAGTVGWCDECAKPPQWSTEPPTEPGYWWTRYREPDYEEKPTVRDITVSDLPYPRGNYREWWPVPIAPPGGGK